MLEAFYSEDSGDTSSDDPPPQDKPPSPPSLKTSKLSIHSKAYKPSKSEFS